MKTFESAKTLSEVATIVCSELNCSSVLVTQLTSDSQLILANAGAKLPSKFEVSSPLNYSICQHTVAMDFPLVIDDAIYHPLLVGNLAFPELGIQAYLGAPVHVLEGKAVGAICALEHHQRRWEPGDIELMTKAAHATDRLIAQSMK